jgi:hypothetical protein
LDIFDRERNPMSQERCTTCYGTGELVSEHGPAACPDCFGDGHRLGSGAKLEWRLRELERLHRGGGSEADADVLWLIHELRKSREALLLILSRCQDADAEDALAADVKFRANEALGIYDPERE